MKSTKLVIATVTWMLVTSHALADNPLKALFPTSGKSKQASSFQLPFVPQPKQADKFLGLPTPGALIDKAEKQTDAIISRSRKNWNEVKGFGRSLNPFAQQKAKQPKKSWLDRIFPKQPVSQPPATMGEFLNMKRPG